MFNPDLIEMLTVEERQRITLFHTGYANMEGGKDHWKDHWEIYWPAALNLLLNACTTRNDVGMILVLGTTANDWDSEHHSGPEYSRRVDRKVGELLVRAIRRGIVPEFIS